MVMVSEAVERRECHMQGVIKGINREKGKLVGSTDWIGKAIVLVDSICESRLSTRVVQMQRRSRQGKKAVRIAHPTYSIQSGLVATPQGKRLVRVLSQKISIAVAIRLSLHIATRTIALLFTRLILHIAHRT